MAPSRDPLGVPTLARDVWRDFRRGWRSLVIFDLLFKLIEAWLLVPAVAVVLTIVLAHAGHVAVSNFDILDFLLSPLGLLYGAILATTIVALLLVEQGGIMVLAARNESPQRPSVAQATLDAIPQSWRILQMGVVKVIALALAYVPLVLLALVAYNLLLSQHDIYFYLSDRPTAFWVAAATALVLLLVAAAIGLWLYVRWALALPIVLFERGSARFALRASRERVQGAGWRVAVLLVVWPLGAVVAGLIVEAVFGVFAASVLSNAGERPIALILSLLVMQATLFAGLSFVASIGHALTVRRVYLARSQHLLGADEIAGRVDDQPPAWIRWAAYLSLACVVLAPLAYWINLPRTLKLRPPVRITAHRGHSSAAPENTLSAVRKAIESGADYVEIDVQPTADGVVVLLHDRDLKRVAGDSRPLAEVTFDEARKLDVGSFFSPSFAAERIPTLAEVIDLCRGRIRLNIEMKSSDRRLIAEVVRLVREHDVESECLITSFDYEALQDVKRDNPRLRTGLIVAQALGDLNRLGVDMINVRADLVTPQLMRSAHRAGQEVHAWTVSDPRQMVELMRQGVDNVLTSNPDALLRVRDEWEQMSPSERLILAARMLLGVQGQRH